MKVKQKGLGLHHIYLLQIMAQSADVQINEYKWDHDEVSVGIKNFWWIAFTGWYLDLEPNRLPENLLPGFALDIVEIDQKLRAGGQDTDGLIWTTTGLATHPFWNDIRALARAALNHRNIATEKPNPEGWYMVLPEELH